MPKSPHDLLFRTTFSNPANAAGALRSLLPEAVARSLDWSQLEVVSGASYVDRSLQERELDLLYRVPLAGATEPALVYLLFEHQSTVDRRMPARLLVYAARVLDRWMRDHPRARHIPLLIPMVLHHSHSGWSAPTRVLDLVAAPKALRAEVAPHVPDFTFLLDDISRATQAELYGRALTPPARLALWALSIGRDADTSGESLRLAARLLIEVLAAPDGLAAIESVFSYLHEVRDDDLIDALAHQTENHRIEDFAMNYKQQLIEKGREEGQAKARESARGVLRKLLLLKFGELDQAAERRVEAASLAEIDAWSERVLEAGSLGDIFIDVPD